MKNVCLCDIKKTILFVSPTYPGKEHDKTIFLKESLFSFLPDEVKKYFDLAFEGIEKDSPDMLHIRKPMKKPKGKELTKTQKAKNKRISSKRVIVENAFAGAKRLKITWDIFRNTKEGFADLVFWLACGIWNFYLKPG